MSPLPRSPERCAYPALMSGRGLDVVKILAAAAMLVDHAGYILTGENLYMFLIGRMAYPLFAFAAAVTILRRQDDSAYLYRQAGILLLCALLSEPVSQLTREGYQVLNVLFTLALSLAAAPVLMACRSWLRLMVYGLAVAVCALPGGWEFGAAGMLLPVAIAVAMAGSRVDAVAAVVLAGMMNFGGYAQWNAYHFELMLATAVFSTLAPAALLHVINAFYARQAPRARLLSRYALHIFYPAHMLALWGCALLVRALAQA